MIPKNEKRVSNNSKIETKQGDGVYRGHPTYKINPSIAGNLPVKVKQNKPSRMGGAYVISKDGDILADGGIAFIEEQEIDSEQFVKIYLEGIRQYGQLSKAGAKLFEYVYKEMSGHKAKDKDTITISLHLAQEWFPKLAKPTYYRGLAELLDQGFLFRSYASIDLYFVNILYMFNGDRLVLAKAYRRVETTTPAQLDSDEPCIDVDSTASE